MDHADWELLLVLFVVLFAIALSVILPFLMYAL